MYVQYLHSYMLNRALKFTSSTRHFTAFECLASASVHETQSSNAVYLTKIRERVQRYLRAVSMWYYVRMYIYFPGFVIIKYGST